MQNSSGWHTLCTNNADLPNLLLKSTFTSDGYSIQLTDLSRLWTQHLTKNQIANQARHSKCSIDASQDDEQYHILRSKLLSALNQDPGTTLTLSPGLKLHLSAPLPSPLPPLEWTAVLSLASPENLSSSLVQPLLSQAHTLQTQIRDLIAELQAKDKVIAKITDRLETSGHDLTAVFPGVSNVRISKKRSQQEQLARHVVGLGKFEEGVWRERVGRDGGGVVLTGEVLDGVLGGLREVDVGEGKGKWWRRMEGGKIVLGGDVANGGLQPGKFTDSARGSQDASRTPKCEDDEFQRQATPPRFRDNTEMHSKTAINGHSPSEDEDDDDDDDLDAPSQPTRRSQQSQPSQNQNAQEQIASKELQPRKTQPFEEDDDDETEDEDDVTKSVSKRQPSPPPKPASPAPRKKLGAIGGKIQKMSPDTPSPAATASGDDKMSEPPSSPPPPSKPKAKSKLGTIGGKAKRAKSPDPPDDASSAPASPANPKAKRLGILGGKKTTSVGQAPSSPDPRTPDPDERPSRMETREPESEPAVRETSEERADRKREMLKRELAERAKQPLKKKRRF